MCVYVVIKYVRNFDSTLKRVSIDLKIIIDRSVGVKMGENVFFLQF